MGSIILDYKLNFSPDLTEAQAEALHQRTASKILHCCQQNEGLYIKFGQVFALNAAVLPAPFATTLKVLYDDAPAVGMDQVISIFQEEFGQSPQRLFRSFSPSPIASASIAQVHRATRWDGQEVAVKVQKPSIHLQMNADLSIYRFVIGVFEWAFDLPMLWTADYTIRHIRQETDFLREASNAQEASAHLATDPDLSHDIYIPRVFPEETSSRILTCEWVNGVKVTEVNDIHAMGLSIPRVMALVVDLFAFQIFQSGFVHCDPHPGNVLVRRHPSNPFVPQILLIDHGLYMREDPAFRKQYCQLWKALLLQDLKALESICSKWGISDIPIFASATLMRPWNIGGIQSSINEPTSTSSTQQDTYSSQSEAKDRVRAFLSNSQSIPLELIMVGRNLNIVRSINRSAGSPVNRIGLMADRAVRALGFDGSRNIGRRIRSRWMWIRFRLSLWTLSLAFHAVHAYQCLLHYMTGQRALGFEETLDRQVSQAMKDQFGITLQENIFEG
ncbi:MAG: ABC1 family-domain-containing protein [Piptocephalis tieghemiana]|nr:MAG: ABC1 family-domain-containing protein [Piptocephalis tieghemiana]